MPKDLYELLDNGENTADRTYVFDMPPSANRYWRHFRGHMVVSSEAKAYKRHVAQVTLVNDVNDPLNRGGGMLTGRVAIRAHYMIADNRRFDLDNRIKVLLDAMQGIVYKDDQQIYAIYAEKEIQPRAKKAPKPVERVIVYVYDAARIVTTAPPLSYHGLTVVNEPLLAFIGDFKTCLKDGISDLLSERQDFDGADRQTYGQLLGAKLSNAADHLAELLDEYALSAKAIEDRYENGEIEANTEVAANDLARIFAPSFPIDFDNL